MKTYQIYIDSANAINAATGGSQRQYKFDWNILPEGEYEFYIYVANPKTYQRRSGSINLPN